MEVRNELLALNYGHFIPRSRIVVILPAEGQPSARFKAAAKAEGKLIDATRGRQTRSMILVDTGHLIMVAIKPLTLAARYESMESIGETTDD